MKSVSALERIDRFFEGSLILLLACGFSAVLVAGVLGPFAIAAMLAALSYRTARVLGWIRFQMGRRTATAFALALVALYPIDVFWLSADYVAATVRMLFLFTALKLFSARQGRDFLYLGVLSFLHLLAASMFVIGIWFVGLLFFYVILAVTTYTAFEVRSGAQAADKVVSGHWGGRLRRTLPLFGFALATGILALSVGLFLVLPRATGSGGFSMRSDYFVGFATQVDLGLTGSLSSTPVPVMRVQPLNSSSVSGLYWRGVTMHAFDGVRWSSTHASPARTIEPRSGRYPIPNVPRRQGEGRRITYRVTLEPLPTNALFLVGETERVTGPFPKLLKADDGGLIVPGVSAQGLRYQAVSWLVDRRRIKPTNVAERLSDDFKRRYLQLPAYDPRIAELAHALTDGFSSSLDKARNIERYLKTSFRYTLDLPAQRAEDPLANFLFERGEGHCEYFASAMGVMLRIVGIPSRLAGGFAGGIHNPLTGMHVLRSSDAHSWVESYIPGYGWLEFDPSPERPAALTGGMFADLWMYWDALQAGWVDWVVDYDTTRQAQLALAVQDRSRSAVLDAALGWESLRDSFRGLWSDWSRGVAAGAAGAWRPAAAFAAAILSALAGWMLWPQVARLLRRRRLAGGRGRSDDCRYFFERALAVLARRGLRRHKHETAEELAARVPAGELGDRYRAVMAVYNAARFGADRRAESQLPEVVRRLEAARS